MLPPNCPRTGQTFYNDLNLCRPDGLCGRVRNPANYAIVRLRHAVRDREQSRGKGKKEEEAAEAEA
jgi:hypothetical protein